MRIIETCPVCGSDLYDEVIDVYPPIQRKICSKCGWSLAGRNEEVVRIPFKPQNSSWCEATYDPVPPCCRHCSNHPCNGGSGICNCTLPYMTYTGGNGTIVYTTNISDLEKINPSGYSYTSVTIKD